MIDPEVEGDLGTDRQHKRVEGADAETRDQKAEQAGHERGYQTLREQRQDQSTTTRAERQAYRYLIEKGLTLVCSNYRCRLGEIDLIMKDREYLVFVEVRHRSHSGYGGALASIGHRKIGRLRATAAHYLQRSDPGETRPCRFDVVVSDSRPGVECTWIRNAFD